MLDNTDPKDKSLTGKQKKFCEEYIFDFNATRAAKEAGYSEATAYSIGSENLSKPEIKAYIEDLQSDLAKVAGISRLMVLREHQKMAFSSIAHLHLTWLTRKEFNGLTEDQKACIQEISTKCTTEKDAFGNPVDHEYVKIKLYDKQKALDSINKMLGYDAPNKTELIINESQTFEIGGQKITF